MALPSIQDQFVNLKKDFFLGLENAAARVKIDYLIQTIVVLNQSEASLHALGVRNELINHFFSSKVLQPYFSKNNPFKGRAISLLQNAGILSMSTIDNLIGQTAGKRSLGLYQVLLHYKRGDEALFPMQLITEPTNLQKLKKHIAMHSLLLKSMTHEEQLDLAVLFNNAPAAIALFEAYKENLGAAYLNNLYLQIWTQADPTLVSYFLKNGSIKSDQPIAPSTQLPIDLVLKSGKAATLRLLLLYGASLKEADLVKAVQTKNPEILDIFEEQGLFRSTPDLINQCDDTNVPPLFYARSIPMVKKLLELGASINFQSQENGRTFLFQYILDLIETEKKLSRKHKDFIEFLIKNGADLAICDTAGVTILQHLVVGIHWEILEFLFRIDPSSRFFKDTSLNSLVHEICTQEVSTFYTSFSPTWDELHTPGEGGTTPFQIALKTNESISLLIFQNHQSSLQKMQKTFLQGTTIFQVSEYCSQMTNHANCLRGIRKGSEKVELFPETHKDDYSCLTKYFVIGEENFKEAMNRITQNIHQQVNGEERLKKLSFYCQALNDLYYVLTESEPLLDLSIADFKEQVRAGIQSLRTLSLQIFQVPVMVDLTSME